MFALLVARTDDVCNCSSEKNQRGMMNFLVRFVHQPRSRVPYRTLFQTEPRLALLVADCSNTQPSVLRWREIPKWIAGSADSSSGVTGPTPNSGSARAADGRARAGDAPQRLGTLFERSSVQSVTARRGENRQAVFPVLRRTCLAGSGQQPLRPADAVDVYRPPIFLAAIPRRFARAVAGAAATATCPFRVCSCPAGWRSYPCPRESRS